MPGKKLLVADDSLTIQKVIRLALASPASQAADAYEIQAVSDGTDAVQQITLFRPDIVLIDVSLPGRTAFEVKREVNQHDDLEEVRFVLMSSAFEKVDEDQVEEVTFHGRLTKPFDPAHLRRVLSDVLEQVKKKRMEPTSILERPAPPPPTPIAKKSLLVPAKEEVAPPAPAKPPFNDFPLHSDDKTPSGILGFTINDDEAEEPQEALPEDLDDDLPTVKAPTTEAVSSLWDEANDITHRLEKEVRATKPPRAGNPPPRPPATPPPASPLQEDSDIRQLTESTIRISGLDDYQWSVNEPSLKRPAASMSELADLSGTTFRVEAPVDFGSDGGTSGGFPAFNPDRAESITPPRKSPASSPSSTPASKSPKKLTLEPPSVTDDEEPFEEVVSFGIGEPVPLAPAPERAPEREHTPRPAPLAPAPSADLPNIEALIRKQVQETLQEMVSRVIPDVAERIIKEEIHRLLSEQP